MALSIELPTLLDQELAEEAAREGVTPSEQAALLLVLATSLTGEGRKTPFRSVVREFLKQNALDADHLADVCEGLMALCLRHESGSTSTVDSNPVMSADGTKSGEARALLREWRSPDVHRPIGLDAHIEITQVEFPPLDQLIQRMGRVRRSSVLGKYAYLGGGTEEFMREKQLEIDREDRR